MLFRKAFLVCLVLTVFCTGFNLVEGEGMANGEEKEKSELAVLMGEIDENYKVLERLATYLSFEEIENEREVYGNASANLVALCETATTKFARPDDDTYQELNQAMLTASENIDAVFINTEAESSLEDVLWQVGLLRQSCADCHKHLDIQIGRVEHGK